MTISKSSTGKILTLILITSFLSCTTKTEPAEHSPEKSLADLKVYDGLEVTLFASEPMMTNPTNIDIDARGRVWVCEAYNYRSSLNPGNPVKKEGDRLLILEDTDGDGKADEQKVFYQGTDINAALGVCVLGNKVIVSCSPNVYIFTDENGDDVPDKKEILFKGIKGEQHDHGMHSFYFGHDGRLYFSMGNAGQCMLSADGDTIIDVHGRKVVTNGKPFREGMVIRMNPDGTNVEVVAHNFRNNYESTLDPFGTIWQSDNDDDGNKGTRINYVMEFGNYGFRDEMTGAGWRTRRTNWEKEIPLRHWHLNDPGVVPNLLQTGSGSPSGMTMNEGTLLPDIFYGQIIHAEPGHNVVRSYVVENDGAGYKASIVNILEGQNDQWFRPIDVSFAPDGSLFVADWYDPGVGGHQVGDQERGRIYRIAPQRKYKVKPLSINAAEEATQALLNPNTATRYLAWTTLASLGKEAEKELKNIWTSSNKRHRAQSLWLLARLENGDSYIDQAIQDNDADIRITGLRVARELGKNVLPLIKSLINDPSPQVRREVAIALRGNSSKGAAELWTTLALQYDGNDRWYLEALGISAWGNDDLYFDTWKKKVGQEWNKSPNTDIVWRIRSRATLPLMAELISSSDDKSMLRYYRSFDFHPEREKQQILVQLAINTKGEKSMYALRHMDPSQIKMTASLKGKLNEVLKDYENKIEYVELVNSFNLKDKAPNLLALGLNFPDSTSGKEAIQTLMKWNRFDLFEKVLSSSSKEDQRALIKTIQPIMYDQKIVTMMETVVLDSTQDLGIRKAAVHTFGGHGESEGRLLTLAKENKIPENLQDAARDVFQHIWRKDMREEAAKYIKLPSSKDGTTLPDVAVLESKNGSAEHGKEIFKAQCNTCHRVNGEGTDFGPGLSEIGDKLSKQAMYRAILYPDQGISFGYEGYSLKLKDGSEAFGMISSETESEVEVKYINNKQIVNKADIISREQISNSLMPANLQAGLSEQDLVDLVEYLISLKGSNNL
ncbi:MAG TPA: PVC-type heme-binding CxxCH protein [Cyclobacteriaceae bacterium]|nr:PVC-type heme-binding CxxCH protein [Cyclobacteriaceae bacterium]